MLTIKSDHEIELMRVAGKITAMALDAVERAIRPGITTKELEQIAGNIIIENGAEPSFYKYEGFPGLICISVNEEIAHGIPSNRQLKNGDIVSVDIGVCYQGYHGDAAKTYPCGSVSPEKLKLISITRQALLNGLKMARPNSHLSDISHSIEEYITMNDYKIIKECTGHGIGKKLHEQPIVLNFGPKGEGIILKKGMTFAIEPTVSKNEVSIETKSDGWTLIDKLNNFVAHEELTILINDNGYEILTKYKKENE